MLTDIEDLRLEARYHRERYDLRRAKAYGGRLVSPRRLRELEGAAKGAEARLKRAEAALHPDAPRTATATRGEGNARE